MCTTVIMSIVILYNQENSFLQLINFVCQTEGRHLSIYLYINRKLISTKKKSVVVLFILCNSRYNVPMLNK